MNDVAASIQALANQLNQYAVAAVESSRQRRNTQKLASYMDNLNVKNWTLQNEYNSPSSVMQRYREAGLNPNLIYGDLNSTFAESVGQMSTPKMDANSHYESISQSLASALQVRNLEAQNRLLNSQAAAQDSVAELNLQNAAKSAAETDYRKWLNSPQMRKVEENQLRSLSQKSWQELHKIALENNWLPVNLPIESAIKANTRELLVAQTGTEQARNKLVYAQTNEAIANLSEIAARVVLLGKQSEYTSANTQYIIKNTEKLTFDMYKVIEDTRRIIAERGVATQEGVQKVLENTFMTIFGDKKMPSSTFMEFLSKGIMSLSTGNATEMREGAQRIFNQMNNYK